MKMKKQCEPLFESTMDQWAQSAKARMTPEGLRSAAEALRKGQTEIRGYRSLPDHSRKK